MIDIKYPAQMKSGYRAVVDQYYSVQLSINGLIDIYLFKLRDIFSKGMCIAVKEDFAILKYIKAGDMLNVKYCTINMGLTANIETKELVSKRFSPKSAFICSRSRKAKILTTVIHVVFRGFIRLGRVKI